MNNHETNEHKEACGKIVVVGHVDHGKSTLLGRILMDSGLLTNEKLASVQKTCASKNISFEPAFFLDALQEEQEQCVSIDTTRINFQFAGRQFLLIDAPGHLEFLRNMSTGSSEAELAILIVDCTEGIRAQTVRHLQVLSVLGISRVVVVVNKLDKVNYQQSVFEQVAEKVQAEVEKEGLLCQAVVPVSALNGENLKEESEHLPWYFGLPLLPLLASLMPDDNAGAEAAEIAREPLRMILQDVYHFAEKRYFAGRLISGQLKAGDEIAFSPSGKVSRVKSIIQFPNENLHLAVRGNSVALELEDQVFVERGEVIGRPEDMPEVDNEISARIVWLSANPFNPEMTYLVKIGSGDARARLAVADKALSSLMYHASLNMENGTVADVKITTVKPLAFDRQTGRHFVNKLVICDQYETVAAGIVDLAPVASAPVERFTVDAQPRVQPNIHIESGYVERAEHERANGHRGTVLWLTGLSGAGKSSLARSLQRYLSDNGFKSNVLDGDNLRSGLCAGLGFSPADRAENIRRAAQAAKLFMNTGFITIVAVVSPYARDREIAREIIGDADFNEIFVFCPLEVCQERDPKGLYAKARDGSLPMFQGFDIPYQPPKKPAVRIDTSLLTVEQEVSILLDFMARKNLMQRFPLCQIDNVSVSTL